MKKFFRLFLIIFFPLGILYCVGKNLFSGNFISFLGGIFLILLGFLISILLLRQDIVQNFLSFFKV